MSIDNYFLGCPIWANKEWVGEFFTKSAKPKDFLSQYSQVFNSVEGNTTFYGLPKVETVLKWKDETPPDFRFSFKFPQIISHIRMLLNAEQETFGFFKRLETLNERLGCFLSAIAAVI